MKKILAAFAGAAAVCILSTGCHSVFSGNTSVELVPYSGELEQVPSAKVDYDSYTGVAGNEYYRYNPDRAFYLHYDEGEKNALISFEPLDYVEETGNTVYAYQILTGGKNGRRMHTMLMAFNRKTSVYQVFFDAETDPDQEPSMIARRVTVGGMKQYYLFFGGFGFFFTEDGTPFRQVRLASGYEECLERESEQASDFKITSMSVIPWRDSGCAITMNFTVYWSAKLDENSQWSEIGVEDPDFSDESARESSEASQEQSGTYSMIYYIYDLGGKLMESRQEGGFWLTGEKQFVMREGQSGGEDATSLSVGDSIEGWKVYLDAAGEQEMYSQMGGFVSRTELVEEEAENGEEEDEEEEGEEFYRVWLSAGSYAGSAQLEYSFLKKGRIFSPSDDSRYFYSYNPSLLPTLGPPRVLTRLPVARNGLNLVPTGTVLPGNAVPQLGRFPALIDLGLSLDGTPVIITKGYLWYIKKGSYSMPIAWLRRPIQMQSDIEAKMPSKTQTEENLQASELPQMQVATVSTGQYADQYKNSDDQLLDKLPPDVVASNSDANMDEEILINDGVKIGDQVLDPVVSANEDNYELYSVTGWGKGVLVSSPENGIVYCTWPKGNLEVRQLIPEPMYMTWPLQNGNILAAGFLREDATSAYTAADLPYAVLYEIDLSSISGE